MSTALATRDAERLADLEVSIAQGLTTFVEVGAALAEIREARLYRATHGTFEDYVQDRWQLKRQRAYELIAAATTAANVSEISDSPPLRESHVAPLASLEPEQQREVWKVAVETAPNGKVTAAHVSETVERARLEEPSRLAVHRSSETGEWYTPAHIIAAVRSALGRIDLDPCSNPGEPAVPATKHFTYMDDGLTQEWAGTVYMNPPYGRGIGDWTSKLVAAFQSGAVSAAIALVPARTDTVWMNDLREYPRCFVRGRIAFSGHENAAPFPSCAVYLGSAPQDFAAAFAELGDTYVLLDNG